jgi:hypothetical protein
MNLEKSQFTLLEEVVKFFFRQNVVLKKAESECFNILAEKLKRVLR